MEDRNQVNFIEAKAIFNIVSQAEGHGHHFWWGWLEDIPPKLKIAVGKNMEGIAPRIHIPELAVPH